MARTRYLKPDFFTDADLGELSPLHRLMFQGLWCHADRDGRLEDRPRELKVKVLPFDDCDAERLLADLAARGFILRYEAEGEHYIAIPGFPKHQKFHRDEKPRGLPPPPQQGVSTVPAGCEQGAGRVPAAGATARPVVPAAEAPRASTPGNFNGDGDSNVERGTEPPALTRAPAAAPLAERVAALREALEAVFLADKGTPYRWTPADEMALPSLLAAGDLDTCRRHFRNGLRRPVWPRCGTVADLNKHWNHYAQEEAAAPPKRADDVRRGVVRAEDMKHAPTGVVEI